MTRSRLVVALVLVVGCTHSDEMSFIDGFAPPQAQSEYTRFVMPTVTGIKPGDDLMFCQWVAAPSDNDRQIVDTTGFQSTGGHHIALYATSQVEEVGTSRICTIRDMLTVNFVGAVGEEGISAAKLPDGLAFKVPKGFALMANTHYSNHGDEILDGQSVVDVKFAAPDRQLTAAGNIAVNNDGFSIPAGAQLTSDGYCKATTKLSLFMWGNHMHEWGTQAMSEIIRVDGTRERLATDDDWSAHKTFSPTWSQWETSSPFVIHPGDTFHVQCSWHNTTAEALTFPVEMCVSTGFTLEEMPQSVCQTTPEL